MSLDVSLWQGGDCRYSANITHNLGGMAEAAGMYKALWRPEEINASYAEDIIPSLQEGLIALVMNPTQYRQHDAPNGWGKWEDLVRFTAEYLEACRKFRTATIEISR